jgi:hypothetical protein
MSVLKVDLTNVASMKLAAALIALVLSGNVMNGASAFKPEPDVAEEDISEPENETLSEEDGDLGDLLNDEQEEEGISVADVKAAITKLAKTKGTETMTRLMGQVFKKLGVKKLDEIPEDKRQTVIDVVAKASK